MDEQQKKNVEGWDALANQFDESANRAEYFAADWMRKHVEEIGNMLGCRVLDLGCGPGVNIKALREHHAGIRADGVDISPKMIEQARATGAYQNLYVQNLDHPLSGVASDEFDLAIAFGFLEFLTDVYVCLSECNRALKTNGMLWATFRRFEAGDAFSPPRVVGDELKQIGHSASEILHMAKRLKMKVLNLDTAVGYVTSNGFAVPYYVLQARKMAIPRSS